MPILRNRIRKRSVGSDRSCHAVSPAEVITPTAAGSPPRIGRSTRAAAIQLILILIAVFAGSIDYVIAQNSITPTPHSKIVIIGNTLAERMIYDGQLETLIQTRFPQQQLVIRNLGWSADEIDLQPRSEGFAKHGHSLTDYKPDLILAMFGFNESFAGVTGQSDFATRLRTFIKTCQAGLNLANPAARLVLISPTACEDLRKSRPGLVDPAALNERIAAYTDIMRSVAEAERIPFVDLFTPTLPAMADQDTDLTINAIHLNHAGQTFVAGLIDRALFGPRTADMELYQQATRLEVTEKNRQFLYDFRAANGCYIYGSRQGTFGEAHYPAEFSKLKRMIALRDQRIWDAASGKVLAPEIDDSSTGTLPTITSNYDGQIQWTTPQESLEKFIVPDDFEVNLFASESDFPNLCNPVQIAFDGDGKLWVCTMPSYPQYIPGEPANDKILVYEDTDNDGRADKETVFAENLYLPTGIELGHGGVYVAQQPNLLFLKDTNGDGVADVREIIVHGFDNADCHHGISNLVWGPGGGLFLSEGTFHYTQIETPHGPVRSKNGAIFRYHPATERISIHVAYNFVNPWGHVFDRWGEDFLADAATGFTFWGAPLSGRIVDDQKRPELEPLFTKQWRPTCGCEIISSRNFPESMQHDLLLNNTIGFHGILQYRLATDGSGVTGIPAKPLLRSSDPNFRPVDLEFAPDGSLYFVDWYNPLIGHIQHSFRDPNRDHSHGRIWRLRYLKNALVDPPKITGQPISTLLELLKSYEDRTRYRVRTEIASRDRNEIRPAIDTWVSKLDTGDPDYPHHLLEALWVCQSHHIIHRQLLDQVLQSTDPRARTAAIRVVSYWLDQIPDGEEILRKMVADPSPRVRLEGVRAASFLSPKVGIEIAQQSANFEQDYCLRYTLEETLKTLKLIQDSQP